MFPSVFLSFYCVMSLNREQRSSTEPIVLINMMKFTAHRRHPIAVPVRVPAWGDRIYAAREPMAPTQVAKSIYHVLKLLGWL